MTVFEGMYPMCICGSSSEALLENKCETDAAGTDLANEGNQMMLAQRVDLDVLDQDHLVVSFVEQGIVDETFDVCLVALGEKHEGLGIPRRRVQEAFSIWVFANAFEEGANGPSHSVHPSGFLFIGF